MKVDITVTLTYTKEINDSLFDSFNLRRFHKDWTDEEIVSHLIKEKKEQLDSIYDVEKDLDLDTSYDMTVTVRENTGE
jgi:hypothetical protein